MNTITNESNEETQTQDENIAESTSAQSGGQDNSGRDAGDESGETGAAAVEIDGHKFKSEAEALKWALENKSKLERDNLIAEAYRNGIQDAQVRSNEQVVVPQQDEDDPDFETKFYTDPKKVLKELREKTKREAFDEFQKFSQTRDIERQVWDDFTGLHPDLADFKEDVEFVANSLEHREIVQALARTKGQKTAMDYVAQKTRAKFQAYVEKSKTAVVLPRGNTSAVSPSGGQKSVTKKPAEDKPLSMRDQLRQIKNKQLGK